MSTQWNRNGGPEVSLTVGTEGGPINLRDLSRYLHYLRAAYVRCLEVSGEQQAFWSPGDVMPLAERIALHAVSGKPPIQGFAFSAVASTDLPSQQDLLLYDIRRNNPLELVLGGVGVVVVAAVILSGGELKIGVTGIHLKVNSLGDGIKKIKDAFARRSTRASPTRRKATRQEGDA